jgi:hypothetical protein
MLTSLPALKAVTILCNVFMSALTIFPFSDGFELVGSRTFGEYADMYVGVVLRKGVRFRRIDVVFDRYFQQDV